MKFSLLVDIVVLAVAVSNCAVMRPPVVLLTTHQSNCIAAHIAIGVEAIPQAAEALSDACRIPKSLELRVEESINDYGMQRKAFIADGQAVGGITK